MRRHPVLLTVLLVVLVVAAVVASAMQSPPADHGDRVSGVAGAGDAEHAVTLGNKTHGRVWVGNSADTGGSARGPV